MDRADRSSFNPSSLECLNNIQTAFPRSNFQFPALSIEPNDKHTTRRNRETNNEGGERKKRAQDRGSRTHVTYL